MNDLKNAKIKESIRDAMPQVPESYMAMVQNTISELKGADNAGREIVQEEKRRSMRWYRRVAVAVASLIVILGGTFSIYPALASEIPLINKCVYALSPTVEPRKPVVGEIKEKVTTVLYAFINGEQVEIEKHFLGEKWAQDENVYLAIAYLRYLGNREELQISGDVDIEIQAKVGSVEIKKKAFIYEVNTIFELISKEGAVQIEECSFRIIENIDGYYILKVELQSENYRKYADDYVTFYGEPVISDNIPEQVLYDNAFIIYQKSQAGKAYQIEQRKAYLQKLLERIGESQIERKHKERLNTLVQNEQYRLEAEITEEILKIEELASELMYRYYQGRVSGIVADFSDVMVRNLQTDLFFYEALLVAERTRLGILRPLAHAEKGQAEVLDFMQETVEQIQVRFYVWTKTDYGVGEEIILTFKKAEGEYMIIGYDREVGDGIYLNRLKPLAEQYRDEGMGWEAANRLAYERIFAEEVQMIE